MTDPQIDNIAPYVNTDTIIGLNGTNGQTGTIANTITLLKATTSTALRVAVSGIGRKALLTGMLYLAGGTLISVIGPVPVLAASAIIWLL